jgi:sterol desaturase/sphingolipid hydroxylase (fatty acid hydroxylase superfamily)
LEQQYRILKGITQKGKKLKKNLINIESIINKRMIITTTMNAMILIFSLISMFVTICSFSMSRFNPNTYFFEMTTLEECIYAFITLFFGYMSELFLIAYLLERKYTDDTNSLKRKSIMINELKMTLPSILSNDLVFIVWMHYFDSELDRYLWNAYSLDYRSTKLHLLLSFVVFVIFYDAWNYWWHFMFHKFDFLWKFHKLHHQFYGPTAFSFGSVHPFEGIILGITPIIIMKMLLPFHPLMILFCMNTILVYSMMAHDGSYFDFIDHYVHHTKGGKRSSFNYGFFFPIWDISFRTNYDPVNYN